MPNLNANGEWCAGVGGGVASWGTASGTGTVIWTSAGGTDWLTPDILIAQHCPGTCVLKTANVRTSAQATVAPRGANFLSAGGGVWAAWLGGYGLYSSAGFYKANAGAPEVGPDGAFAYKRAYHSYGPWDVREPTGLTWVLTPGDAQGVQLLGSYRGVWSEAGNPRTAGACPVPNPMTRPYYWLKMSPPPDAADPDGWWCLYQASDGRLLLHPVLSASGYQVAPPGSLTYRPDLVRMSPTSIRVVWATSEGEPPSSIVVSNVNLTTGRTVLGTAPPPVWTPPIGPPVPPPGIAIPPYTPSVPAGPFIVPSKPPVLKRSYPHVDGIEDWRAQQSLRLLWDRAFDLEEKVLGALGTQGDLVNGVNSHDDQVRLVDRKADEVLALVQGVLGAFGAAGAGGEGGGGDTGAGSKPPQMPLPDMFGAVKAYADAHPAELAASCRTADPPGTWAFMEGLVAHLRSTDPRVNYNGKRGGSVSSDDAISYYHQSDIAGMVDESNDVYVVDVIVGHCPGPGDPPAGPAWMNVTSPKAKGAVQINS